MTQNNISRGSRKKELLIKKVIESMFLDTIECWRRIHVNDFD